MQARAPRVSNFKTASSTNKAVTPFCGVCFKAGKTKEEYTNHYTKSMPGEGGVVICPTILCNECTYCHEIGHFKNACPRLLSKNKNTKFASGDRFAAAASAGLALSRVLSIPRVNTSNSFSALEDHGDGDDSDDEVEYNVDDLSSTEFPSLSGSKKVEDRVSQDRVSNISMISYASMAAKPAVELIEIRPVLDFTETKIGGKNISHDWADDDYWSDDNEDF